MEREDGTDAAQRDRAIEEMLAARELVLECWRTLEGDFESLLDEYTDKVYLVACHSTEGDA